MSHSTGDFAEIAPRIWRAVCQPDGVNVVLLAGTERALLVDTGSSPEQGREIRAKAEAVLDVPLTHVVVTHAHHDHWYGLAAFADLETYGHQTLADDLDAARADAAGRGVDEVVLPRHLVRMVDVVQLGERFLEIVHPHHAHTHGDLFLTVNDANLLLAGDLLEQSGPPSVEEGSDLEGWVKSLDMMLGSMRRDAAILPGHGDLLTGDLAGWQRSVLNGILTQTKELMEQGITRDKALDGARWPWEDRVRMQSAIDAGYRHWERKGLVARPQLGLQARG